MKLYLLMAKRFYAGEPAWSARDFGMGLGVDQKLVNTILRMLEANGLVVRLVDAPPRFQPSRDLETISLAQVMQSVREPLYASRGRRSGRETSSRKSCARCVACPRKSFPGFQ